MKTTLKQRARELKQCLPAIFLAMKKPETPWTAKLLGAITVGYALSPIDLIPDFIPVLGYLDDLILLPLLAAWTIKLIPTDVMETCKAEATGLWEHGKPKRWYYAIPIVLFWLLILWLIVKAAWLG